MSDKQIFTVIFTVIILIGQSILSGIIGPDKSLVICSILASFVAVAYVKWHVIFKLYALITFIILLTVELTLCIFAYVPPIREGLIAVPFAILDTAFVLSILYGVAALIGRSGEFARRSSSE